MELKENMKLSLAYNVGAWITRDKFIALSTISNNVSVVLTNEHIERYGKDIIKAINMHLLVIGEHEAVLNERPNIGTKIQEALKAGGLVDLDIPDENRAVSKSKIPPNLTAERKKELSAISKRNITEIKSVINKLQDANDMTSLYYLSELEENEHKTPRKSIVNGINNAISKIAKSSKLGISFSNMD